MDCAHCKKQYDSRRRTPRLLTSCGHTLCSECISSLLAASCLLCPACKTRTPGTSVTHFPKNLALLAVQTTTSAKHSCAKHAKPLEAFCSSDNTLLCVNCILEDGHNSHQITSVAKAARRCRDNVAELWSSVQKKQQALNKEQAALKDYMEVLVLRKAQVVLRVQSLFEEFRNALIKEEEAIATAIANEYTAVMGVLKERQTAYEHHMHSVAEFGQARAGCVPADDCDVIRQWRQLEQLGNQACEGLVPFAKSHVFCDFSDENVRSRVLAILKKTEKTSEIPLERRRVSEPILTKLPIQPVAKPRPSVISIDLNAATWPDDLSSIPFSEKCSDTDRSLESLCKFFHSGVLTIAGCADRSVLTTEVYDFRDNQWSYLANCESPRAQFGAVPFGEGVLALGGKYNGKRLSSSMFFKPAENRWSKGSVALSSPRSSFAAAVTTDGLHVFGGNDGVPTKHFQRLTEKGWSTLPSMLFRREEFGGCLGPDQRLYAAGGLGGVELGCLKSLELFSFDTGKWETGPTLPSVRRGPAVVAMPDGMYLVGGFNGATYLKTLEKFDVRMQRWVKLAPMKYSRCSLSAVASKDCQYLYAIGGFNGTVLNSVERYSIFEDKWETLAPLHKARFMHSSLVLNL